eukprot:TRINITY_DN23810_c0_g1_i1.p1 TRINITY_DN23810_c0_g1~~TRINITY_DN23810_c0_g1_i1.p1  ORF type:complete len:334 (+),score=52.51 TRINITY_DN23810_c0_g1_i1:88-1089(+)
MAAGADGDREAWGGDEGVPGGDREWRFRNGALTVKAFEDFVAGAIGGVVTAASIDLSRFVAEEAPEGTWRGRLCVELGSGCGLVSGTLAQLGARVVATEQVPFIEHLQWNLQLNVPPGTSEDVARCEPLDWDNPASRQQLRQAIGDAGADFIVGANCIYATEAVAPFLAGISALTGPSTVAFVCGVPQPTMDQSDATGRETILDAFLAAAPSCFDCYLVSSGGNCVSLPSAVSSAAPAPVPTSENPIGPVDGLDPSFGSGVSSADGAADPATSGARTVDCSDSLPLGASTAHGAAVAISERHGVSLCALSEAVWLLVPHGASVPSWLRPVLKL